MIFIPRQRIERRGIGKRRFFPHRRIEILLAPEGFKCLCVERDQRRAGGLRVLYIFDRRMRRLRDNNLTGHHIHKGFADFFPAVMRIPCGT